jgi:hypothetical protein
VIVDVGLEGLGSEVLQRVAEGEDGSVLVEFYRLLVAVGVAEGGVEGLGEGDGALAGMDGALATVDDGVGSAEGVRGVGLVVELAEDADTDLEEEALVGGVVVADLGVGGAELFDGAGDGVVEERIVSREPLAEVGVALVGDAGDDAGPVEAGAAVVTVGGVGEEEDGFEGAVGEDGAGVIGVGNVGAGGAGLGSVRI